MRIWSYFLDFTKGLCPIGRPHKQRINVDECATDYTIELRPTEKQMKKTKEVPVSLTTHKRILNICILNLIGQFSADSSSTFVNGSDRWTNQVVLADSKEGGASFRLLLRRVWNTELFTPHTNDNDEMLYFSI